MTADFALGVDENHHGGVAFGIDGVREIGGRHEAGADCSAGLEGHAHYTATNEQQMHAVMAMQCGFRPGALYGEQRGPQCGRNLWGKQHDAATLARRC